MPPSIPPGLTREHVLQALADLDAGIDHPFGRPTGYELVHDGKRYAPNAVIGLACQGLLGRVLEPREFSGGEAPGQANYVLEDLGFTIERKQESVALRGDPLIQAERRHRLELWKLLAEKGGPSGVSPSILRELGIYGGAQGIWVDKARTGPISADGSGITVAVLHTGSSYADDLANDCVIYHYPQTRRPAGRDDAEVEATKSAGRHQIPIFVISYPTPSSNRRDVQLGWVESWDDRTRTFLITFGSEPPTLSEIDESEDAEFLVISPEDRKKSEVRIRAGQQRFKFRVLQRYGPECAACGLSILELLDAAHICPKLADGTDDARNGLVLCANHHRAFDRGYFAMDPASLHFHCRPDGPDLNALGISRSGIDHLSRQPHPDAVDWSWKEWRKTLES